MKLSTQKYTRTRHAYLYDECMELQSANLKLDPPLAALPIYFEDIVVENEDENRSIQFCLMFAVLAWSARLSSPSEHTKYLSYFGTETVSHLNYIIMQGVFRKECVFASNLIAWVAYSSCSDEIDPHVHFKHSLGFLNTLSDPGN